MFATHADIYVSMGWAVFPLRSGEKIPFEGTHGVKDASTNDERVSSWAKMHPDANIAIACGAISGLLVVDVDPRNGGFATIDRLKRRGCEFPQTVTVRTQSGGVHLYYADNGLPQGHKRKLRDGIDLQTTGKYVVAPPSRISGGGDYRWERPPMGPNLPSPPRWLFEMIKPEPEPKPSFYNPAPGQMPKSIAALARTLATTGQGNRNHIAYWAAMRAAEEARAAGIDPSAAYKELHRAALSAGLTPQEAGLALRALRPKGIT